MASTSTSTNVPPRLSHPVTVSGVVENSGVLPPSDNRKFSFRSCTVSITCNGWDSDRAREYDGVLTSHCAQTDEPLEAHCYVIKSRFLPDATSAMYTMYHEAEHKILVGSSESFTGVLHNNTAITGLGIVHSKTTIPDDATGKETLCFVMKHVDYKPETRKNYAFEIEYRIRPTRNLEKSQGLIQLHRETLISGFIVDWDDNNCRWIVEVCSYLLRSPSLFLT
ncbi:hypothetical protein DFH28DRAFT_914021 [Melampsora americana]|nr:hypothetical protein DFH28DRAFT_914021 [Melampsora americana]